MVDENGILSWEVSTALVAGPKELPLAMVLLSMTATKSSIISMAESTAVGWILREEECRVLLHFDSS